MLNRSLRLLVVAFCTILTQWACQPTRDTLVEPQAQDISIAEAKLQYEAWATPKARKSAKTKSRKPMWEAAQRIKLKDGTEAIETPLLYNWSRQLGSLPEKFTDPAATRLEMQANLVSHRDKQGIVQSYVVTLLPDEVYQKSDKQGGKAKFSGVLMVQNLDEDLFVGAWRVKDDKVMAEVEIGRGGQSDRNGRRQCPAVQYEVWEEITKIEFDQLKPTCDCNTITNVRVGAVGSHYYKLAGTITVEQCSAGSGTGGSSSNTGTGFNGPAYTNPYGGLYGGPSGTGYIYVPKPYELDPAFVATLGPIDQFFYRLASQQRVFFNDEEQELIYANPNLTNAISQHIVATGTKPDLTILFPLGTWLTTQQIIQQINLLDRERPAGLTQTELDLLGFSTLSAVDYKINLLKFHHDARMATLQAIFETAR